MLQILWIPCWRFLSQRLLQVAPPPWPRSHLEQSSTKGALKNLWFRCFENAKKNTSFKAVSPLDAIYVVTFFRFHNNQNASESTRFSHWFPFFWPQAHVRMSSLKLFSCLIEPISIYKPFYPPEMCFKTINHGKWPVLQVICIALPIQHIHTWGFSSSQLVKWPEGIRFYKESLVPFNSVSHWVGASHNSTHYATALFGPWKSSTQRWRPRDFGTPSDGQCSLGKW